MSDSAKLEAIKDYIKDLEVRKNGLLEEHLVLRNSIHEVKQSEPPAKMYLDNLIRQLMRSQYITNELSTHISHLEGILNA